MYHSSLKKTYSTHIKELPPILSLTSKFKFSMSNVCVNMIISVWHFEFPSTWVVWIGTLWCINHLKANLSGNTLFLWSHQAIIRKKIYLTAHNMSSIFLLQFIGSRFDVCYMMPTILLCCWITLISVMYTRQIPIIEVAQSVVVVPYALLLIDLPGWPALWEMISNRKRHVTFSVFITRWKKIVYKIFSTVLIARKELLFKYKFIFQRKLTSLFNETPLNLCHPCTTPMVEH